MKKEIAWRIKAIDFALKDDLDFTGDTNEAVDSLLRYAGFQLYRLEDSLKGPIDNLAWIVRNLLETSVWLEFVLESKSNAAIFLEEYQTDRKELLYKMNETLAVMNQQPFTEPKPKRPMMLQRKSLEQNMDYKLCSKFIHPTAWLLGRREIFENKEYRATLPVRKAFFARALHYSFEITAGVYLNGETKAP